MADHILGLTIMARHGDEEGFLVVASRLDDTGQVSDHRHCDDLAAVQVEVGLAMHTTFATETPVADEADRLLAEERP